MGRIAGKHKKKENNPPKKRAIHGEDDDMMNDEICAYMFSLLPEINFYLLNKCEHKGQKVFSLFIIFKITYIFILNKKSKIGN